LPHAIKVTPANTTDREGALELFSVFRSGFTRIIKLFCDSAYTGENFANEIGNLLGAMVEVVKRNELHKFVVLPKRWIVERTFSWLDKYRRFWRNSERYTETVQQLATIAFIRLILKRY
jgi:transposase